MKEQTPIHYEIEHKYLIAYPDENLLLTQDDAKKIEISQTYLTKGDNGENRRVRSWKEEGRITYFYTEKKKLSDLKRIENEKEISADRYAELLRQKDPACHTIDKIRYCIPYRNHLLEIDIFSFWDKQAYLEIEVEDEIQEITLPPYVRVIREVTGEKGYSNHALSRKIPPQELQSQDK